MAELHEKIFIFCFSSELQNQFEKSLSRSFNLDFVYNKEDIVKLVQEGVKPVAIFVEVASHFTKGFELLVEMKEECPYASRIIITDIREPRELIPVLRDTGAMMYLKYPCTNFDIFQAAVLGAKHADMQRKLQTMNDLESDKSAEILANIDKIDRQNKEIKHEADNLTKANSVLQDEVADLSKLIAGKETIIEQITHDNNKLQSKLEAIIAEQAEKQISTSQADDIINHLHMELDLVKEELNKEKQFHLDYNSILALSTYLRELNKFSFVDHTYYVSSLVKDLANHMQIEESKKRTLMLAALLHNYSISTMPNYFQVANPNTLIPEKRKHYFYYFKRALRILKNVKPFREAVEMIEHIWEHADGTGFPDGIPGMRLSEESQVLAIANLYVKSVFSLNEKEFNTLMMDKKILQAPETTKKKQKAAMNLIYQNTYWYKDSVRKAFIELSEKGESNAFNIPQRALLIDINELISSDNQKAKNEFVEVDFYDAELMLDWKTGTGHKVYVHSKELNISDLKHGMILAKDIVSDGGAVVLNHNTEIKDAEYQKIWQMISKDLLHGTAKIYIPIEPDQ